MSIDSGRAERLARNQSLFREINDRLVELRSSAAQPRSHFLCECASDGCVEHIRIAPAQYQHVRSSPVTFAVLSDQAHVYGDVERVVDRQPGYWVVEKLGKAAHVARAEFERNGSDRDR